MFENDVSRTGDIGVLLVASGGTLMVIAGALAAFLAVSTPSASFMVSGLI